MTNPALSQGDRAPLLVHFPGDEVWIGKDIKGRVVQVCIHTNRLCQFQISWWNGRERKIEWFEDFEVTPISPNGPFMQIGFHQ